MRSAKEAVAYMKKIHTLVRYLEICDGNMQEGSFRCDANVSVRPKGQAEVRHARRDQEPQFVPLRRARDQLRGRAPGRADRGRRQGRAGNAPVRPGSRRDALDALEGRGERLPLLPGSGPAAARDRRRDDRVGPGDAAGAAGREGGALRRGARALRLRRRRAHREPRTRRLLRDRGEGPRRPAEAGRELGHGRALRCAQQGRPRGRAEPRRGARARAAARAHRRQHDLRQDRQGSVRGDVDRRQGRRRDHRRARPQADHRHLRDREGHRRGDGGQSAAARRLPLGQGQAVRLLRRAGDEGHPGQGKSGTAERVAEAQARPVEEQRHDRDPRGRLRAERRRRAAVHFLLPPGGLHRAPRSRLRARTVAGREGCHRADPDELAHVRGGQAPDLPGHGHRQHVPQGRHGRALGDEAQPRRDGERGRAPRLRVPGQPAARVGGGRPGLCPQEHPRQHAGRVPRRARAGQYRRGDGGREGRRLGEQVEVRDAESQRLDRGLGAEDRADDGCGLVPARHARARHRRHGREGHAARQGSADGPARHARAHRARPVEQARGTADLAVREGQCARHRRAGPRRPHDGARREDPHLRDACGLEAGRDDPELRRDAPCALRARRLRAGAARAAVARAAGRR